MRDFSMKILGYWLALVVTAALVGCTLKQLDTAQQVSAGAATAAGKAATAPGVAGTPWGELALAAAAFLWTSERFFAWRLKLKKKDAEKKTAAAVEAKQEKPL